MNRIIIKIGSRVLAKEDGQLSSEVIAHLVEDVARVKSASKNSKKIAIISSGAVSSGRITTELQGKFSIDAGGQDKNIAREQVLAAIGQPELMSFYKSEFKKHGIICAQILVTRADFADRQRYLSLRAVAENLLNLGIVPIFNENDVLSAEELDFNDNDQLACMVASMLAADKLIMLTNVAGVYDRSPKEAGAKLLPEIKDIKSIIKQIGPDKSDAGKGGMRSKLYSAELITSLGIPMHIASGFEKNIVSKIVANKEQIGTLFPASDKKIKPVKSWLAASAVAKGKIIVTACLADVLARRQKASILLLGIESVDGTFNKDDVVEVCGPDGKVLGKGKSRYDSDQLEKEIKKYKQLHSEQKKTEGGKKIAIHYDHFVFA
jgi:glutamate 5-kinase